jgi:hypothetical protein
MPLPENTAPMMTGQGPYGSVEMGGMFSVLKVRSDQAPGDYSNSGWFQQPEGTQASPVDLDELALVLSDDPGESLMSATEKEVDSIEVRIKKPTHGKHS